MYQVGLDFSVHFRVPFQVFGAFRQASLVEASAVTQYPAESTTTFIQMNGNERTYHGICFYTHWFLTLGTCISFSASLIVTDLEYF